MSQGFKAELTQAQEGLWYAQQLDTTNPIFNAGHYIEIIGPLNVALLFVATRRVIAQAQALALRFEVQQEQVSQIYAEQNKPEVQLVDLRNQPDAKEQAVQQIRQELARAKDLAGEPLATFKIFALSETHHIWFQSVHHLLADGYAMQLLEKQVAAYYNQLLTIEQGQAAEADRVVEFTSYQAIIAADNAYKNSAKQQQDKLFWQQYFAQPATVSSLKVSGVASSHSYVRCESNYQQQNFAKLQSYCQRRNLLWPDVVTALTAVFLCRHSSTKSNVFGIPFMARLGSQAANVPAMVMNVLPLKVEFSEGDEIERFCLELSKQMRLLRRHGHYRSEQLRRDLGLSGSSRLYGATINVLPFDQTMQLNGVQTKRQVLSTGPVEDLTVTFRADGSQGLILTLDANPHYYSLVELQRLKDRLEYFIGNCLEHRSFSEVASVTAQEYRQAVYEVNDTAVAVPATTLSQLVDDCAANYGTKVALKWQHQEFTYTQFIEQRDKLAAQLLKSGVQRQSIVALLLERSADLVLAIHAIVKIGAIYLPLDVSFPSRRLSKICQVDKPQLLIYQKQTATKAQQLGADVNGFDISAAAFTEDDCVISAAAAQPGDAAYIIFTSGSTGEPKGVVVEHQAIVNRLLWMKEHYHIGCGQRILQKTPYSFDVSVWEFFLPFISGAALVVAEPGAHKDPQWLLDIIVREQITVIHFVPSMLEVFLAEPQLPAQLPLQQVFCSGEALAAGLRDQFHQRIAAQLHNLYGPTEAAVDVAYWEAGRDDTSQPVPIGFPVWNTQLYVLDDNLQPTPPQVVGTLYISGKQLARGYLGRDDLTRQRFIANPFIDGQLMYNTGDLAKRRADGAIEFFGRADFQIKIRGLRIELDEIQSVINSCPQVQSAAVVVRQETVGQPYIAAYVVGQGEIDCAELAETVAEVLPDYMVPTAWMQLEQLPISANGKLDRKALPQPHLQHKSGTSPQTAVQQKLAQLYAQVLQFNQPVYLEDDFFALGGHSLLAAKLISQIKQSWPVTIGLGAIFEHPKLADLAALIEQLLQQDEMVVDLKQQGMAPLIRLSPLAAAESAPLFCLHPAGGVSWCYANLARALQPTRPVYGLQAPMLDLTYPQPASLVALAADYIQRIRQLQPQGPYYLVGWSVGGIIAQAMAAQLQQDGQQVAMLALLDAYPSDVWRAKPEPEADAAHKALLLIAGIDPHELVNQELNQHNVIQLIRQRQHPLGSLTDELLAGILRVVKANNELVRGFSHQRFGGEILFFTAGLDHQGENLAANMWQPYCRQIQEIKLPCLHGHMVNAAMSKQIARVMLNYLAPSDA